MLSEHIPDKKCRLSDSRTYGMHKKGTLQKVYTLLSSINISKDALFERNNSK